jgi:hypothetical protein
VTSVAGLELAPGASVTLPNAVQGVFAVSGFTPGTEGTGTVSTNAAQGGSVLTVAKIAWRAGGWVVRQATY